MDDVAGYRILRGAARGDRTRLFVGFDGDHPVVLKVTAASDERAAAEAEALERAAGEHVVALLDVSADDSDSVLVLERLANGTLADLFDRRDGLDVGEAVTILAPLAVTIDRIHAAGVAHGALSLGAICFRDDGAPTLVGFGRAELFAAGCPEVVLEGIPGVRADREAVRGIVALVLERVVGEGAASARTYAASVAAAAPSEVASGLFDLAAPAPVRFADNVDGLAATRMHPPQAAPIVDEARGVFPPWLANLIPDGLAQRLEEPAARIVEVWSGWAPRRKRVILGALAGGVTLLVAVALVPARTGSPEPPTPAVDFVGPPSSSATERPVVSRDPVEAATELLNHRERCFRDVSLLCLDAVVQPGSAAQTDDMALIRAVLAGEEYPGTGIAPGSPVLAERLGDIALVDLPPGSEPTSILLVLHADGWRIRDYLDASRPTGEGADVR